MVAEVLFPNTIPPFFPTGLLATHQPTTRDDYDHRLAGIQAHNRWLADFCAETPGRRAGIAQIFLYDVDDAVAEIRRAREADLFGGILLPGVAPDSGLPPLYAPEYEPIWAVCEDLDMPINNHAGSGGARLRRYPATPAVFIIELSWYSHRVFWHMLFGNVFSRHPRLRLALTEQSSGWVPSVLAMLDSQYNRFQVPGTSEFRIAGAVAAEMGETPSETWARNCFLGVELPAPERVRAALRDRRRQDHVGPGLPACRGHLSVHHRSAAQHVRRRPHRRSRGHGRENAARFYGFDLDALAPIAAQVGPTVDEIATPLDKIPDDAYSVAFTGEAAKPW